MNPENARRIRKSFIILTPQFDGVSGNFYHRVFTAHPELRRLFPQDMAPQRGHFGAALALIVRNLHMLDALAATLAELGAEHARAGVRAQDYPIFRDAMLAAMSDALTPIHQWSPELAEDWRKLFDHVSAAMLGGRTDALDEMQLVRTAL